MAIIIIIVFTLNNNSDNSDIAPNMDYSGFVIVNDVIPDIVTEMRYYSSFNFFGAHIDGYEEPVALLAKEAAEKLKKASDEFDKLEYRIKIYIIIKKK